MISCAMVAAVARTNTLLLYALWVARLNGWPVRPSPSWSPLFGGRQTAVLPVWTFCPAQRAREGRCLVSLGGLFARRREWTRPMGSMWGDWILSHRETLAVPLSSLRSYSGTRPPTPHRARNYASVSVGKFDSTPARTVLRKHRRIAPDVAVSALACLTTGAGQTRDPSWCPVTPSFGGSPTAGRQWVFSWVASVLVVKSHLEDRM